MNLEMNSVVTFSLTRCPNEFVGHHNISTGMVFNLQNYVSVQQQIVGLSLLSPDLGLSVLQTVAPFFWLNEFENELLSNLK